MNIRWKRGFFRIWILVALLWGATIVWVQINASPPPFDPNMPFKIWYDDLPSPRTHSGCEDAAKKEPLVIVETCVEYAYARNRKDAEKVLLVVVPPLLLLMFGVGIGWIVRGFKPQSTSSQSK
jgi:hypothetical protein